VDTTLVVASADEAFYTRPGSNWGIVLSRGGKFRRTCNLARKAFGYGGSFELMAYPLNADQVDDLYQELVDLQFGVVRRQALPICERGLLGRRTFVVGGNYVVVGPLDREEVLRLVKVVQQFIERGGTRCAS
jgi:hypothetical protein